MAKEKTDWEAKMREAFGGSCHASLEGAVLRLLYEFAEEAAEACRELRDSPMLMGEGAWEDGRIAGLNSAERELCSLLPPKKED